MNKTQVTRKVAMPTILVGVLLALGGCAVIPPSGPSVVALPRKGEPLEQFQQDDYACRDYAYRSTDANGASQAATNNAVGSAATDQRSSPSSMPTSTRDSIVQPCRITPWPTVTFSSMMSGN